MKVLNSRFSIFSYRNQRVMMYEQLNPAAVRFSTSLILGSAILDAIDTS